MKKFNLKEVLVPTLSLFLICAVVTMLLAVTNSVTKPQIEKLQIETANKTKAQVLSVAESFSFFSENRDIVFATDLMFF